MIISRTLSSSDWQINMPASGRKDLRWHKTGRYTILFMVTRCIWRMPPRLIRAYHTGESGQPAHYFDRTDGHGTLICLDHHRQELTIYTDPLQVVRIVFLPDC